MDASGKLPEDLAAEQAYLAELRAEREAQERKAALARRAQLEAQGLLDSAPVSRTEQPLAGRAPLMQNAPATADAIDIPLEQLARLKPELIAQLPPDIRREVEVLRRAAVPPAANAISPEGAVPLTTDQPAAEPGPAAGPGLSEAELARREAEVLARVKAELAEADSPLAQQRKKSRFDVWPIRALEQLLSGAFGRKSTW